MRRFSPTPLLLPLLLAVAGLTGCDMSNGQEKTGESAALKGEGSVSDAVEDVEVTEDPAKLEAAFRVVYSAAPPITVHDDIDTLTVTPQRLIATDFGPVLVTEAKMRDGCHACSGYLSVHYLKPKGGGYALVKSYEKAVPGSDWGNGPDEWSVRARFAANPSIYSERGGMGQGYACASGTVHELTPDGPRRIASFPLRYSNEGAVTDGSGISIKGEIDNIEPRRSFDIEYTGAQRFTDHYVRDGATYALKGKSPMETC